MNRMCELAGQNSHILQVNHTDCTVLCSLMQKLINHRDLSRPDAELLQERPALSDKLVLLAIYPDRPKLIYYVAEQEDFGRARRTAHEEVAA